jgi:hypothetical protein
MEFCSMIVVVAVVVVVVALVTAIAVTIVHVQPFTFCIRTEQEKNNKAGLN